MRQTLTKALLLVTLTLPLGLEAKAGSATFYSDYFIGRRMANGQRFSQQSNSVASNRHKLGAKIKICHKNRCVIGIVRDRCGACSYDLPKSLFRQLAPLKKGRIPVRVRQLN